MCAFTDTEVVTISKAFQRAWDRFLKTGFLTPQNFAESRQLIALRILRAAHFGERNEWRLARDAADYLCDIRHRGKPRQPAPRIVSPSRPRRVRRAKSTTQQPGASPMPIAPAVAAVPA
jgi:hypothetical protein